MAVQMDDYAMRVTGSATPTLNPEDLDVSDDPCLTDKRPYKGEDTTLTSSASTSTAVNTIPMYFASTKQPAHTAQQKSISDPSLDRQADQPASMVPGSQANGKADSSTLPDEDRVQQPHRLVVRLDLRKIHSSSKEDTKAQKKGSSSKHASVARIPRERPDTYLPQDHQETTISTSVAAKGALLNVDLSQANGNCTGSSSAGSTAAEGSDLSSTTLTSASSSSVPLSTSTANPSQMVAQTTEEQEAILTNGRTPSLFSTTAAVPPALDRVVRKRTRSSSEGPDKRIAVSATTESSGTLEVSRIKRRGRPPVPDRPTNGLQSQQDQSFSSPIPKQATPVLRGRPSQKLSVLAKQAQKRDTSTPSLSKQDISVTGDDSAIKHNNDYCESCNGLGQFICCDSCPKAFHFSCCQPPVDPNDLPDEFYCVECKARIHPPEPNKSGLFKQLLDNMDRMNPKAFALPHDIRTYFRGVVTNSDGEYSDAVDYKPTPKRHNSNTGTSLSAEEDPLHLRDANGQFKACFRCNKTSLGRQIIRCDHCPLYWHLDCLSPPMAHPPPSTRKWMCPNHADHVIPRKRKKKNPIPVMLSMPLARNDGDIEVLSDGSDFDERRILLNDGREVSTTSIIYRVPEHSIKLGFVQKCHRVRQQKQQQKDPRGMGTNLNISTLEEDMAEKEDPQMDQVGCSNNRDLSFRRLVEVALLEAQNPDVDGILSTLVPSMSSSSVSTAGRDTHATLLQDSVLKKLESKQEQNEYLHFRAFQRMVREQGADNVVRQLVEVHEAQKAEAAMEGLLEMSIPSPT